MKFFEKYKNPISLGFTAVVTFLAISGSYQYYTQYVEGVSSDRLWSAVLFSAAKLYAFSPTVNAGAATPVFYEIAKWTAPLCTAYWLFRMLDALLRHRLEILTRIFRCQKQIMVFGHNRESEAFLYNLLQEDNTNRRRLMLVTENPPEQEQRLSLEKKHILVWHKNLLDDDNGNAEKKWMQKWLGRCDEIILFYEDATVNFILLRKLMEIPPQKPGDRKARLCSLRCEDKSMKRIITDYYDEYTGGKLFDLNLFSMPEIAAAALFREEPMYRNCLDQAAGQLNAGVLQADKILELLPNPHLLIAGFGRYGQAVMEEALLMGRISCHSQVKNYEMLRITIIDSNPDRCRDIISARYPRADKLCRIHYIACEIESTAVEQRLNQLPPVTYAAICFSNQSASIHALEKLCRYFRISRRLREEEYCFTGDVPVAVRMKINGSIIRYLTVQERNGGQPGYILRDFGTEKRILTHRNVTRFHLEEEARKFNAAYAALRQNPEGKTLPGSEELWSKLNFEKKESNRAQVRSLPYMSALLSLLPALPPQKELLSQGKDYQELARLLQENPLLESLAAQEHSRWCGFYYTYGYVGYWPGQSEKGKEHRICEDGRQYYGMVHYCLIDDWEQMKADPDARETILYDICSIYSYLNMARSENKILS